MIIRRTWRKDISVIVIGKATSRQEIEYLQAWAICNCSWSFPFSSWSFDFSSSRFLICHFISQSSRWCCRFASCSLFRVARDSSSHLAIRAFCYSKVFRLSIVLYKAWDFKKDRLATSYKIPKWDWSDVTNYSTQTSSSKRRFTLVYLKHHCMESASFFTLSTDSNGSSKSSFPNSSWTDWGRVWKGTTRTERFFDPSASSPPIPAAVAVSLVAQMELAWLFRALTPLMFQKYLHLDKQQQSSRPTELLVTRGLIE